MSEPAIRNWLKQVSKTVAARDHAAHMQLFSRDVTLLGVPGFDSIGYDAFYQLFGEFVFALF